LIALVRVDNRLIHGQVVEAWLPALHATRILVADDEAAGSPLTRAAMGLAVPAPVKVEIVPIAKADFAAAQASPERTLVLLRDVHDAMRARELGLSFSALNLGNVHFASGRVQVSSSVFLSPAELEALRRLSGAGVQIDLRPVPKEKPLTLADVESRLGAAQ
jgi:PTS system mannose-specific IIB component